MMMMITMTTMMMTTMKQPFVDNFGHENDDDIDDRYNDMMI